MIDEGEVDGSVRKFELFLPLFSQVLGTHIDTFRKLWSAEYETVLEGHKIIHGTHPRPCKNDTHSHESKPSRGPYTAVGGMTAIRRYEDIGLVVVSTPDPVHYYALFRCVTAHLPMPPHTCDEYAFVTALV
jgi:hypothetical protein